MNAPNTVPITVVTCARNRASVIARCMQTITAAHPAEMIVVDGNSNDNTADVARRFGARVISDNGAGLGAARQLGAEMASQRHVAYVDTDTVLLPDTLEKLLAEAIEGEYDAVTAQLHTLALKPNYWQRAEDWRRRVQKPGGPAERLGCQATLIRRELVRRVRFDPLFSGAGEDMDFFLRARAGGARLANSTYAIAYHEDRRSFSEFVEQQIWYGRGLARVMLRHRGRFVNQAGGEANSAQRHAALEPRYLPFLLSCWSLTAVGMTLETIHLARNPGLLQEFSRPIMSAMG